MSRPGAGVLETVQVESPSPLVQTKNAPASIAGALILIAVETAKLHSESIEDRFVVQAVGLVVDGNN